MDQWCVLTIQELQRMLQIAKDQNQNVEIDWVNRTMRIYSAPEKLKKPLHLSTGIVTHCPRIIYEFAG